MSDTRMSTIKSLKPHSAEAARYALLRRLAPALRHDMVGTFQPLSLMATLLEKRVQASSPDLALIGKNSGSMKMLSREASVACVALMSWLQPSGNCSVRLDAGIEDSLHLITAELCLRGFTVINNTAGVDMEVAQSMLRNVFLASLMAMTDTAPSTAELVLTAEVVDDALVLAIVMKVMQGVRPLEGFQAYRALDWDDVQSLADDEGVSIQHENASVASACRISISGGAHLLETMA